MTTKHITTFHYKNETYEVVRDNDNYFWAFNEKDIDSNGRLKKEFNGLTGYRNAELNDTLIAVMTNIDVAEWDAQNPKEDKFDMERLLAIKDIYEANTKRINQ